MYEDMKVQNMEFIEFTEVALDILHDNHVAISRYNTLHVASLNKT